MGTEIPAGESPQQTLATGRRWSFGNAVLDERSLELQVNGARVKIEPKPLEVLIYLLNHAGEIVTKDELQDALWAGRILTESVLTRTISVVRQALGDREHVLVKTVHGYGYRFATDLKVETSPATDTPTFAFESGSHPPQRPHWKLAERLGGGGAGEAWLARHDKNQDARVFKFALDGPALTSFKREITLYRVLRNTLGTRAPIAQIYDWNLEQPPFFLEVEYVEGRDLQSWAESQGGLSRIPLATRLDLAIQIAEALAAAHSVGVLHKDLKPGNVLIQMAGDEFAATVKPRAKLCDFGSGGVLDPERLKELGITQLGFTLPLATGGTPLYIAPEVLDGHAMTVQGDIYALGVMLYQLVVGNFQKTLAPGWENDVDDELLQEDIALAAAGDPARRLPDAAMLAERLRTLETRRQARAEELQAHQRDERTRRIATDLRRARVFIVALLVLASAAILGGVTAYRSRNQAIAATATATAISSFLTDDVLGIDPSLERPSDASYESLLARAAKQIGKRFLDQPEAAANLHLILGRRYQEIGQVEAAGPQYEKAVTLFDSLESADSDQRLLATERLATVYFDRGRMKAGLALFDQLVDKCTTLHGPRNLGTLLLRTKRARAVIFAGDFSTGETELRAIFSELRRADPPGEDTKRLFKEWFGVALTNDISALRDDSSLDQLLQAYVSGELAGYLVDTAGEYSESEALYRQTISTQSKLLGETGEIIAEDRFGLALALAAQQRFEEGDEQLEKASLFFEEWTPPHHWLRAMPKYFFARARLEQRLPKQAATLLYEALDLCGVHGCSPRVREEVRYELGVALEQTGHLQEAQEMLRTSLAAYESIRGKSHLGSIRRRIAFADTLRERGKLAEATTTLAEISQTDLATLPRPNHLVLAEYLRALGLLSLQSREQDRAAPALEEALTIFQMRLGPEHWKTKRAIQELETARRSKI